jgi:NhaA family Na+:H+ antiporter
MLASVVLRTRNATYRRLCEVEEADLDQDGVPDVYQDRRG